MVGTETSESTGVPRPAWNTETTYREEPGRGTGATRVIKTTRSPSGKTLWETVAYGLNT